MKLVDVTRREFLQSSGGAFSALWLSSNWSAIVAAGGHAQQAARSPTPVKFDVLTPEQAIEVAAIAARIIPSDDTPGASEAGVVYFIDRALTGFASDSVALYKGGLADLRDRVRETFPGLEKFSSASAEQQDAILQALEADAPLAKGSARVSPKAFFGLVRGHTVTGFLVDPESGGNHGGVGWKVIGREPAHMFQPPFGSYDKDYPGWQATPPAADKK
jgi:gluconate 2-dehydrogenase gamma chain